MEKDRVGESYSWVYGWKVKDGKCVPPAKNHPLPEFVQKRIDWVSNEIQNGMLTFRGAFKMLLDIDDEEDLKEDWELGAASDYMPVSDKYREWLQDPILHDIRRVAVMVGFIYA
ncbi:hypothetical protein ACQRAC_08440 [Lactobacillus johnsonii]|uniref:hypothetical protein n=1 Tax=Lactobacillus johnsonii TaxID=33959 RepID=UPI003D031AB7